MIPENMDREAFVKRRRFGAEYLSRIARASAETRTEPMVEWAEKLYDDYARGRVYLMESPADVSRLLLDLRLFYSGTVMPLLAEARPSDFELEAIRLAIAGRESEWLATAHAERGLPKKFVATPLGRNLDRFRRECGWSFDDMAAATEIDKKLILGHVNKGKNAHPKTLATYARTFTEKLGQPVTVAALEG
jgi:hypothetical protein